MKVLFLLLSFPNKLPLFQLPGAAMNSENVFKMPAAVADDDVLIIYWSKPESQKPLVTNIHFA